jgi:hypothetical protein
MILTREQLDEIARRRQGTLKEAPFAVLLCALAANRQTAVLELRRHQIAKRIVFELGVPVDCRSNLVHETLGRFLVEKGLITDEQDRETLNEAANHGVPQGEVLRAHRLISAYELYRRLQENLAKKLLDGFTWREGEYRLLFEVPPVDSPLKVKVPQLVTTGVSRFSSQEEINAGVAPLIGQPLTLHPQPPFPLPEIRLTSAQLILAQALREPLRLDELAAATELDFDTVARELYALAVVGAVVPQTAVPAGLKGSGPVAITAEERDRSETGTVAVGSMAPEEVERRRNEIMEAYLAHRRQDAFDLLGLSEGANLPTMEQAYLEYSQRFAPWQFEDVALRSLEDKARELFLAGATAYAQLVDSEQRNAILYRREVRRQEKSAPPKPDAFQIQTDLLDPQLQFRRGRILMEEGKYLEALELLDFASDCDPQNGTYRAEAAYCRYRYSPRVNAKKAIASLRETLRIDPRCGTAHLYLGELFAAQDSAAARKHLEQAARQLPEDPRPRELLRTLSG